VQCIALHCSVVAVQCSAVQCRAEQCSAVVVRAVQCSTVQYSALQWRCSVLQYRALHFRPVHFSGGAVQCSELQLCPALGPASIQHCVVVCITLLCQITTFAPTGRDWRGCGHCQDLGCPGTWRIFYTVLYLHCTALHCTALLALLALHCTAHDYIG
jgi:hypothetical protein